MFICSFLARVGKKRTKETPFKVERRLKIRQAECSFKLVVMPNFLAILSPLKIPLSAVPRAERVGGVYFKVIAIEMADMEPDGGARDADKKASRLP